jgi:rod shape-determining protein MreD
MLVLFWCLHLPSVAGIGLAWIAGLLFDAASGAPLGSHALIFTLATALTLAAQRLLLTLSVIQQALWVAILVLFQQLMLLLLLPAGIGTLSLVGYLIPALIALVLWPLIHFVLSSLVRRNTTV